MTMKKRPTTKAPLRQCDTCHRDLPRRAYRRECATCIKRAAGTPTYHFADMPTRARW
jgi:hypothetical protein